MHNETNQLILIDTNIATYYISGVSMCFVMYLLLFVYALFVLVNRSMAFAKQYEDKVKV